MNEPEMNAAQRAAFQRAIEEQLIKYVKQIDLRKWAMQAALDNIPKLTPEADLIPVAQAIYDFVSKP